MHVLLIQGDRTTAGNIGAMLESGRVTVRMADKGRAGVQLARDANFDAVLLDSHLSDISAPHVLQQLLDIKPELPVFILNRGPHRIDPTLYMDAGARDVLVAPFMRNDLISRLHTLSGKDDPTSGVINAGPLSIDINIKRLTLAGVPLALRGKPYEVLEYLALHKGQTVSQSELHEALYGDEDRDPKIIPIYINSIRNVISDATGGENYIETLPGKGYILHDYPVPMPSRQLQAVHIAAVERKSVQTPPRQPRMHRPPHRKAQPS